MFFFVPNVNYYVTLGPYNSPMSNSEEHLMKWVSCEF